MPRTPSETARTKMLEAAGWLVLDVGVHAFTIDEVARRSGVAKTTIYRHFDGRNELLIAALDAATAEPPTPDTGTLRQDLIEFLASVLPIFADERLRAATLELLAAGVRDAALRAVHEAATARRLLPMRTIIDRAQARGELPAHLDFETAFETIEGPFIVRSLIRPEALVDVDLPRLVDRLIAMLNV